MSSWVRTGAQLLDDRVERVPGGDQLLADALGSRHQVGELVLLGKRLAQVVVGDEVELDRRLAEAPAQLALALQHLLGIGRGELALVHQDRAEVAPGGARGALDRQNVVGGFREHG
jgi:hypothetical protein